MKTSLFEKAITYNFEKLFKDKGYVWFDKGNYKQCPECSKELD